jgi:hypothetical protein
LGTDKAESAERSNPFVETANFARCRVFVENAFRNAASQFRLHSFQSITSSHFVAGCNREFDIFDKCADAADPVCVEFGAARIATDALFGLRRIGH